jgi:hypothetical protein
MEERRPVKCSCEYASREAWNKALDNAAALAWDYSVVLAEAIEALKKPERSERYVDTSSEPVTLYREIEPPTYVEGLPGFLK